MPSISLYFGRDFLDPKWAGITYKLDCPTGHRRGSEWALGRAADCDLTIDIKNVSRRHAAVSYSYAGDTWSLQDLGSNAGTTLNGIFLKQGDLYPLKIGDRFYLGPNRVNVVEDEQDTINDLGPPTVGSTEPITVWPTPTDEPPAPPQPAPRTNQELVYVSLQWLFSGRTTADKIYRFIVTVVLVAVAVWVWVSLTH